MNTLEKPFPKIYRQPFQWLHATFNVPYQLRMILASLSEISAQLKVIKARLDAQRPEE